MNQEISARQYREMEDIVANQTGEDALREAATAAAAKIAPLWPLKNFVAVNPMLGFVGEPFEAAAAGIAATTGATLLMDRPYYARALAEGRMTTAHLRAALDALDVRDMTPDDVLSTLSTPPPASSAGLVETVADAAAGATGEDWAAFATDQISFWAGAYFDEGQANWRNPWRDLDPYRAWRAQAMIDRTPEIMGLKGFRAVVAGMPDDALGLLAHAARRLGVPPRAHQAYFHRLLTTVSGWAGHARHNGWRGELRGQSPAQVVEILAVRAAFDVAIAECLDTDALRVLWEAALQRMQALTPDAVDRAALVAQTALERAMQEHLVADIADRARGGAAGETPRPDAQAVSCIDVRSERIRRALETVNPDIETFGFAGFFGFPIELARIGDAQGGLQCPVLLEPPFVIAETDAGADPRGALERVARRGALARAWKRFKGAAVSSFAFVEAWGAAFLGAIARDAVGRPAPETRPLEGLSTSPKQCGMRPCGISLEDRVRTAEGALAGMSIGAATARLVALVGHGSTTTNNPYASGLDCGACGGHTGEANARVAAEVLNDPAVRAALAERGRALPEDTVFVAALHDTTTDEIRIFDEAAAPQSHRQDLAHLRRDFIDASRQARRWRALGLGLAPGDDLDAKTAARSRDWSEVRPEWGLAGCAAFIAAPRARTAGIDLGGRAFLHSYDWRADEDAKILELIMTAPLVVASWISLQYYASTTDNAVFGSGDKTLHNVVGGLGVYEGNGGDLRVGLPLQSVHDGDAPFHQPLRLTAMIEAPIASINGVLSEHEQVRALFDNGWLNLVAILDEGRAFARYEGDFAWKTVDLADPVVATSAAA